LRHRFLGLGGALALLLTTVTATPAIASAAAGDATTCTAPDLVQPFLSWGDDNWYTLAPGESADNVDGSGWSLSGGAGLVTTGLADGATGSVLDLPSGATAISPPICVDSDYPTARTLINATTHAKLKVGVSYVGGKSQMSGVLQGDGRGWELSQPLKLHPGNGDGWQIVRFEFDSDGADGRDAQLYDFYVDPRMKS
jgi:hypothetical protein